MFTQCTNCQAIFSVNMREITVSKGYLRCGECHAVFDSSKSLSTTMQAPFVAQTAKAIAKENLQTMSSLDDWQSNSSNNPENEQIDLRQSLTAEPVTKKSKAKQPEYPNTKLFKTKGSEKALRKDKRRRKVGSISAKWIVYRKLN